MHRARPAVLLVHDDGDVRVEAARWLTGAGCRCYVADDAGSADRVASWLIPDVLVIAASAIGSRKLSACDGEWSSTTAVVVIDNARRSRGTARRATDSPANHITLASPVSAEELLHAVRSALAWRAEMATLADRARAELVETVRTRQRALEQMVMASATPRAAHQRLERMFSTPPPVFGHTRRVAGLAREMAESLGLSAAACAEIEDAALVHDIGKLALPDAILSGAAPLGDSQMDALLDSHTRTIELLDGPRGFASASWMIRQSREWWDGSGGPAGASGWDIPIGARILAVADALETARDCEGRASATCASVSAALSSRVGTRFDPDVVRIGLRAMEGRSCC